MVTDFYGVFLDELGKLLEIPLVPDENNSCLIKLQNEMTVQIEPERSNQYMLLVSEIGQIPPGKYREKIFAEALKANDQPYPRLGIFAYSKQADKLVFFERFPVKELKAARVAEIFPAFMERAKLWKDAVTAGTMPAIAVTDAKSAPTGMFGLK